MYRIPVCILGVLLTLAACSDDPVQVEEEADGITFTAAGLQAFVANGTHDPDEILAGSFALSFADSLNGVLRDRVRVCDRDGRRASDAARYVPGRDGDAVW
jgi:hypothetical protein